MQSCSAPSDCAKAAALCAGALAQVPSRTSPRSISSLLTVRFRTSKPMSDGAAPSGRGTCTARARTCKEPRESWSGLAVSVAAAGSAAWGAGTSLCKGALGKASGTELSTGAMRGKGAIGSLATLGKDADAGTGGCFHVSDSPHRPPPVINAEPAPIAKSQAIANFGLRSTGAGKLALRVAWSGRILPARKTRRAAPRSCAVSKEGAFSKASAR